MIALLVALGVDVCVRAHPNRHINFRRGKRLGRYDRLITWSKPTRCPEWMDEATFASIPDTLTLRQMRFNVVEPGCRAETITIITTLTDVEAYPAEDIAELYGFRWNSELDILAIKQTLGLDHLRCKSPEMVRREIWTSDSDDGRGRRPVARKTASANQLHRHLPVRVGFLDDTFVGYGCSRKPPGVLPNHASPDIAMRGARPARPRGTPGYQTPSPPVQTHAGTALGTEGPTST